jgi:HAD superfamily hydrolase (TIGR01549 family)
LYDAFKREFGVERPARVLFHGLTDRTIVSSLFQKHAIDDTEANFARLCRAYLQLLPDSLRQRNGIILAGVAELLDQLARRRNDVAVGLLTGNVVDGARIKLSYFGLYHHFAFGGYGDRHHRREEVASDAIAAARSHLNGEVQPERTYVVGDTPNDIRCARHIGARAVAVCTGGFSADDLSSERPDWLVNDLSDPTPILQLLS